MEMVILCPSTHLIKIKLRNATIYCKPIMSTIADSARHIAIGGNENVTTQWHQGTKLYYANSIKQERDHHISLNLLRCDV